MTFFADHGGDGSLRKHRLFELDLDAAPATVAAGIAAGTRTCTPSSMHAISTGTVLAVLDADGTAGESVTVTGTTGSTFTAVFALAHANNFTVTAPDPLYWTDLDIDIIWNSKRWRVASVQSSSVTRQPTGSTGSIVVGDAESAALFRLLATQNGGQLKRVSIYEAGFLLTNKTAVPDQVVQVFSGLIDRAAPTTDGSDLVQIDLMPTDQGNGQVPFRLLAGLVRQLP